jgi:hypothetical protein
VANTANKINIISLKIRPIEIRKAFALPLEILVCIIEKKPAPNDMLTTKPVNKPNTTMYSIIAKS